MQKKIIDRRILFVILCTVNDLQRQMDKQRKRRYSTLIKKEDGKYWVNYFYQPTELIENCHEI